MSDVSNTVLEVFTNVLENMAFMFPEPLAPGEIPEYNTNALGAQLKFSGPLNGCLQAVAPHAFCEALAYAMLGLDPGDELPDNALEDALKELVNVATGEFLEKLAGERPLFHLTVPTCSQYSPSEFQKFAALPGVAVLIVDDMPFAACAKITP